MVWLRLLVLLFVNFGLISQAYAQNLSPLTEEPSTSNTSANDDAFFMSFLNMLVTLALVIVVLLMISWFFKKVLNNRIQQANVSSPIKILDRRPLTAKTAIYIIEIHGKKLAVAEGSSGIVKLVELDNIKGDT